MVQVRLREQHRQAAAAQAADHLRQALGERGREPLEGLVEQQQLRADRERAAERGELLLPAGEQQRAALRERLELGHDAVDETQALFRDERPGSPYRKEDVLL